MSLSVGDHIPEITLKDQDGVIRASTDVRGKTLVLFFYPKDDTPGCTAEVCSFRDSHAALLGFGAEVWGVSSDTDASHQRFARRHQLPFPLLSDRGSNLRRAFGVPRALGLFPGRVTYVIDAKGIIRHIFNNLLDGPAHVLEARRIVEKLQQGT